MRQKSQHSSLTICCSGFEPIEKENIKKAAIALGALYSDNLISHTNVVLISNIANTNKCIAALLNKIPVVTLNWLEECKKQGKIVGFSTHKLPSLYKIKIALFKIIDEEYINAIKANGGIIANDFEQSHVIVAQSRSDYEEMLSTIESNVLKNVSIVSMDWCNKCILEGKYIATDEFDIRKTISIMPEENKAKKIEFHEASKVYEKMDVSNTQGMILKNCVFYCHDVDNNEKKEQLRLISLLGGIWLTKYCTSVTHIITKVMKEKNEFKTNIDDYTVPPYFVDLHWSQKCIVDGKKLSEESFKPIVMGDSVMQMPMKESEKKEIKSNLFKGIIFTINEDSYIPQLLEKITKDIIENNGRIISLKLEKNNANYIVCNDGTLIEPNNESQIAISHRWIEYSLTYKKPVDLQKNTLLYLLPLGFPIPYKNFSNLKIVLTGFNIYEKHILTNLLQVMGAEIKSKLCAEVTHLVCQASGTKTHIKSKEFPHIKCTKVEWLLDMNERGEYIDEKDYLLAYPQ